MDIYSGDTLDDFTIVCELLEELKLTRLSRALGKSLSPVMLRDCIDLLKARGLREGNRQLLSELEMNHLTFSIH
jgi:hypothetical protein